MPVTFGLHGLPLDAYDDRDGAAFLAGYARAVEVLGPEFTTLWASDHLQFDDGTVLECWTRLVYLAARFERFKVGSLVLGQGYRNPALLAKMAATLQFLTDGRFVLGIGAGWKEDEYRAYGYDYPSRKQRVDQLREALTILRLMWQGGPVTFDGEYYSVADAYCMPKPAPPIPVVIGSGGARVMRLAAEHGDGWNWDALPDSFPALRDQMATMLDEVGRPADTFAISANIIVDFPDDASTFVGIERTDFPEYDNDQVVWGPTPADAIAGLRPFVDLGVTHFQVSPSDLRTLERFAADVAPVLARS